MVENVPLAGDTIVLTQDKGVSKKILVIGEGEDYPQEGQEVLVNYEGRL
jgi:FKBP-type peptidyl-prolyl cis-trans isomerase